MSLPASFSVPARLAPRAEFLETAPRVHCATGVLRRRRGGERDDVELLVPVPGGAVELGLWVRCRGRWGLGRPGGRERAQYDACSEGGVYRARRRLEEEGRMAA